MKQLFSNLESLLGVTLLVFGIGLHFFSLPLACIMVGGLLIALAVIDGAPQKRK